MTKRDLPSAESIEPAALNSDLNPDMGKVRVPTSESPEAPPESDPRRQSSDVPPTGRGEYTEFIGRQYVQLHELKRMYNGMIFQAPTILVAVLGAGGVVLDKAFSKNEFGTILRDLLPSIGLCLGAFAFILSYWAYRSRVLLRQVEIHLEKMDAAYSHIPLSVYPFQLVKHKADKTHPLGFLNRVWSSLTASLSKLQHSTILTITFMFSLSAIISSVSLYHLILQLFELLFCR